MSLLDSSRALDGYEGRPVAVLGAGTLGRRIASCWAANNYLVHLYDPVGNRREEASQYFTENKAIYHKNASTKFAQVIKYADLGSTVRNAWHVIECVLENLDIEQKTFAELEALCAPDSIISTNSSSYRSSVLSEKVGAAVKCRFLNTHYFMSPHVRAVELMTNGSTAPDIFPFLVEPLLEVGLQPFVANKESTGFIQNRVWAAIKREMLQVVAEGVTDPQTADDIFFETIVRPGTRPFVAMDRKSVISFSRSDIQAENDILNAVVGLDTVVDIESNYARERNLVTTHTIDYLQREFVNVGKLGLKSAKGGFYPNTLGGQVTPAGPRIFVPDNGLSGPVNDLKQRKVLEYSSDGKYIRTMFENQYLPDGITVLQEEDLMFWTCMGYPGQNDGMVYSAKLDGSDMRPLVPTETINTPKQITLDRINSKLYFADREGLCIWRCDLDGSNLDQVIVTGDKHDQQDRGDPMKWCVGVTVSPRLRKIFWTQKGAVKGWQGRIFSANMEIRPGETAANRTDTVCLLDHLAEPIDLDFHEESMNLYWTDRGEMPFGNTLNRLPLDSQGQAVYTDSTPLLKYDIVARKFHEAIGLSIDARNQQIYVADLGGLICRCRLDGSDKTRLLFDEDRAWTGIAIV